MRFCTDFKGCLYFVEHLLQTRRGATLYIDEKEFETRGMHALQTCILHLEHRSNFFKEVNSFEQNVQHAGRVILSVMMSDFGEGVREGGTLKGNEVRSGASESTFDENIMERFDCFFRSTRSFRGPGSVGSDGTSSNLTSRSTSSSWSLLSSSDAFPCSIVLRTLFNNNRRGISSGPCKVR